MSEEKLYGLIKNINVENEELHIIEVEIDDYDRNGKPIYVAVTEKCICKRLKYNEGRFLKSSVGNEVDMRYYCAEKGRQICGTCVSNLYGNFLED
jgi:hypothetical protein